MSSDQENVFNAQPDDQSNEQQQAPSQSQIDSLVGEGKKYKTVEDLVAGFYHAQNHIATLEQEHEEYRGKMSEYEEKLKGSQSVLDALEQRNAPSQDKPTRLTSDEEAIRSLVEQVVEQKSSAKVQEENLQKANAKAFEMYGESAKEKVAEAASNLGVSIEFLRNTAKTSPAAFAKLVGENVQSGTSTAKGASPQPSNVNPNSLPKHNGEKDGNYYKQLRRENPRLFKTVAVQQEMMQQRGKLGSKFWNN